MVEVDWRALESAYVVRSGLLSEDQRYQSIGIFFDFDEAKAEADTRIETDGPEAATFKSIQTPDTYYKASNTFYAQVVKGFVKR